MKTVAKYFLLMLIVSFNAMAYEISEEDRKILENLGPTPEGMEYVRCTDTACYLIGTGEVIDMGDKAPGIYLAWALED